MASPNDTAKALLTLAGGPSILGVGALLGYARNVLASNERHSGKGWRTLGAGLLLVGWLVVFVGWAAPTVLRSWFADGSPEVPLVLLSATWVAAIGLLIAAILKAPEVARYVSESYRVGEGPAAVRLLRRLIRQG